MIRKDKLAAAVAITELAALGILGLLHPLPLTVAGVTFVLLSLASAVSPLGTLLATVVALPYFYLPVEFGSQHLAASEFLLLATVPGFIVRGAFDLTRGTASVPAIQESIARIARSRLFLFLLTLTCVGLVTLLAGHEASAQEAGLREWRWSLLLPLVFVAGLALVARRRTPQLLLAFSLIVAGAFASLHGLLDIVTEGGLLVDNVRRLSGPFPHPNALALFLVRPLILGVALIVLLPRFRMPLVPVVVIVAIATFGTFSRGAMIAVAAGAAILSLQTSVRVRYALGAAVVGMGGLALLFAGDRMRSVLDGGSVSLRFDIWSSAGRMIRDSPVLGYGPDQFLYVYSPRYILPTAWDERFTSHAHNLVADSWIRLGIVGAFAACIALVFIIRRVISSQREVGDWGSLRYSALIALAATLVHGLIDNAYFAHDLAISVWLLAWIAVSRPAGDGKTHYDP